MTSKVKRLKNKISRAIETAKFIVQFNEIDARN